MTFTPTVGIVLLCNSYVMNVCKNEVGTLLPVTVVEGLAVNVMPSDRYEFLMTSKEVAKGYGTNDYSLRKAKERHLDELAEGKHYVVGVTKGHSFNLPHNTVLWTKAGVVRLGFFIKSERAKLFRDWAENLILRLDEQRDLFGVSVPVKKLSTKRNHNRLTPTRMNRILADICKIEDAELRNRLANEIMGGN